jgi:replicative DNA helicase
MRAVGGKLVETITSRELQKQWLDWQHLRHENPELYGLRSTGLKSLDSALGGGIELVQYGLFGGATGSGKTTALLQIAKSFAHQRVNYIWFGAEMTNMQVGNMLISNISGIDRTKIRALGLEMHDWVELENAASEIEKFSGYWNYGFGTVEDIAAIIEFVEEHSGQPVRAIFVDYLQLMESPSTKGGRNTEVEAISRHLKRLTTRVGRPMAVLVSSQLNRQSVRGKLIDTSGFLYGGQERDMDFGVIVHDVWDEIGSTKIPNKKAMTVVKGRETGETTKPIEVRFNGRLARMEDDIIVREHAEYWRQ